MAKLPSSGKDTGVKVPYQEEKQGARVICNPNPERRGERMVSRLESTEIRLYTQGEDGLWIVRGRVTVEPGGKPFRSEVQLQFNVRGLQLYRLSPDEAHTIGASLVAHGLECGYDPDTGLTTEITD